MTDWHRQLSYGLRLDWGAAGAAALGPAVAALVIVDVLSFTTAVTEFARQRNSELAVGRRDATPASPWSLSPAALRRARPRRPWSCPPRTGPPSPPRRPA
jgi:2-phosphosulfolactate phosphatase